MSLLEHDPARFDRIVMLLPASLDLPFRNPERFDAIADLLEAYPKDEAIERILEMNEDRYARAPWLRELDLTLWEDMNPVGVARAIREVTRDISISDRELLRKVEAPVLLICREGDAIHPAALGRILADLLPDAELMTLRVGGGADRLDPVADRTRPGVPGGGVSEGEAHDRRARTPRQELLGSTLSALMALQFAAVVMFGKEVAAGDLPFPMLALRFAGQSVLLFLVLLVLRKPLVPSRG